MDAPLQARIMQEIEDALAGGAPVVVATAVSAGEPPRLSVGHKVVVRRDGSSEGSLGDAAVDAAVLETAAAMFTTVPRVAMQTLLASGDGALTDRPSQAGPGAAEVMAQLFHAPSHLVIVGGGHIGLALATVGEFAGFSITVIDDREEFANRERFPMADAVITADAGEALDALDLNLGTYVVLVSRGHRQDEEALRHAVGRGAAYVGMIGSRRRTATVLRHLAEEGVPGAALAVVATPIGLDIGAETPEEIAIAILAEIILLQRGGTGSRMSVLVARETPGHEGEAGAAG
ncbi:MAG: XdhC/CoxI family protein [Dehalococcoidia bacterium]|nr:XdhC/CoxI family protein [Dehalococcoidia bacterium]